MNIYQATLRNSQAVKKLFQEYRKFYKHSAAIQSQSDAFIQERLSDPGSVVFIAEIDGNPVGIAHMYHRLSSVSVRPVLTLNDLFVDPNYRKNGVATALISTCREYAVKHNIRSINLETAKDNFKAKKIYETLGFKLENAYDTYDLEIPADEKYNDTSATIYLDRQIDDSTTGKLSEMTVAMTGVTTILGRKLLNEFITSGYTVLGCGADEQQLSEISKNYTGEFTLVNIGYSPAVQDWVRYLIEKYGVPQFVINNNVLDDSEQKQLENITKETTKVHIDQQLIGTMEVSKAFLPALQLYQNKTALINITAKPTNVIHSTVNAAIDAFTNAIATEKQNMVIAFSIETDVSNASKVVKQIENINPSISGKKICLYGI